jgi:MFS family permease
LTDIDAAVTDPEGKRRWYILILLAMAELMGMSLWFTASAVSSQLQILWNLDSGQVGWLTTAVQVGFVVGTAAAAVLNFADIFPSRAYFAVAALLGAASNAALITVPGFEFALICRFFTGFFLAGVYPPAMKMIATWFRTSRGFAIGTIVGALTVGKATPYLVRAFNSTDWHVIVLTASIGCVLAALTVGLFYRDGPNPFARRSFSWGLVATVVRHRETRLATSGYLGHMWELYAMWTWVPAFIGASAAAWSAKSGLEVGSSVIDILAFGTLAAGGLGCVWGGWAADRIGRGKLVNLSMLISGICCLIIGFCFGGTLWILVPIAWIWGFFVVADSAQFSAMVTELAPDHAVGTALTLQTSVGFLLTMVTIQLIPALVSGWGWPLAFPILALGPAVGIAAIRRL